MRQSFCFALIRETPCTVITRRLNGKCGKDAKKQALEGQKGEDFLTADSAILQEVKARFFFGRRGWANSTILTLEDLISTSAVTDQ